MDKRSGSVVAVTAGSNNPKAEAYSKVLTIQQLRAAFTVSSFFRRLFRYDRSVLLVYKLEVENYSFVTLLLLRLLAKHGSCIEDEGGERRPWNFTLAAAFFLRALLSVFIGTICYIKVRAVIRRRSGDGSRLLRDIPQFIYLRSTLAFGLKAGGSVAHTAGVINAFFERKKTPIVVSTDSLPMLRRGIPVQLVSPRPLFWDSPEVAALSYNERLFKACIEAAKSHPPSFIYQRYSVHSYAGARVAQHLKVPFVLEYNASEVWKGKHWSKRLIFERLADSVELFNFRSAELIVVVSEASKNELLSRGVDPNKILVNPNGVDPEVYDPGVSGDGVRRQLGLSGCFVIGFSGTFEPWHGVDVLLSAISHIREQNNDIQLKVLLIGSGPGLISARKRVLELGLDEWFVFSGMVPQEQGPSYLAACDLFVCPTVPNPDGSEFFGSPTKLFEYLSMGKPVVASRIAQQGKILTHGKTGWLVEPGNDRELAAALIRLAKDGEMRRSLGRLGRELVMDNFTWAKHVERIIAALESSAGL